MEEEADETLYWLELLIESGLVPAEKLKSLIAETNEILSMTQIIRNHEFVIRNYKFKKESQASPFKASMFERGLNPGSNINYEL